MTSPKSKVAFYLSSFFACTILALNSGCASGGYSLTRKYAGWVNSNHIIIRIILFLLTIPVYGVTILIDLVVFNTIDFWEGRISSGTFDYKEGEKTYHVKHELQPGSQLRRSTILVTENSIKREFILNETADKKIELFVDGTLKATVDDISNLPRLTTYDAKGMPTGISQSLFFPPVAAN